MAETNNERSASIDSSNDNFALFMDAISVSDRSNRNKIITDWLAVLSASDQDRLVNKLKNRGIEYQPKENSRFFENS